MAKRTALFGPDPAPAFERFQKGETVTVQRRSGPVVGTVSHQKKDGTVTVKYFDADEESDAYLDSYPQHVARTSPASLRSIAAAPTKSNPITNPDLRVMEGSDVPYAVRYVVRSDFLRDNADDADVISKVRALKPGESVSFGGGAMPSVTVTRMHLKRQS